MTLIKSISGIRGTIGGSTTENLTPIDIAKFASAYATWLKEQSDCSKRLKVVIGRDARISGEMVSTIVEGTLLGCGIDVINIGLASTPTTEMAVTAHSADGGIIVTASHNPKQWNALKLLNSKGEFLSDADGKHILAIADSDSYIFPEVDSLGKVLEHSSYNQQHIEQVLALKLVDVEAIKARKFKVVVDAVNSVGGVIVPEMLRQLGAEVIELNCTPDGQFAHNPEPIPANLTQISEAVVAHHADLGIVVDPDVDRLALINEDGSMFGEEYTLVAAADYVLAHTVGNTVSNLSSSRALRDVTRSYGANYSAAAVGEVNVVTKMKETGAIIGGEGNGGVIYPELHYGRDALVGIGLILSSLAHKGCSLSELRKGFPEYFISKNRIDLSADIDVDKILEDVKKIYSNEEICDIDGVKIDFSDGWVHLRKSNTEPIIRIYSEAATELRANELAHQVMSNIR